MSKIKWSGITGYIGFCPMCNVEFFVPSFTKNCPRCNHHVVLREYEQKKEKDNVK